MQREIERPPQPHDQNHGAEIGAVLRIRNLELPDREPRHAHRSQRKHDRHAAEVNQPRVDHAIDLLGLIARPELGDKLGHRRIEPKVEEPQVLHQ